MTYKFDPERRAYWDEETRAFVPTRGLILMREEIIDASSEEASMITARFHRGEISRMDWLDEFRDHIRAVTETQFMLGRGGLNQMGVDDWAIIDARVDRQESFMQRFASDIESQSITLPQAEYRARLYVESTRSAFEMGRSRAWTSVPMPAYPGDGKQGCFASCRCRWDYRMVDGEVHATWKLNAEAEDCGVCRANAMMYNPYIVTPN